MDEGQSYARFSIDNLWKKSKEKLKDLWTTATVIANGKGKITKEKKATFDNKLDKLFDILYCQHNDECTCQKDRKIPEKDKDFIKAQREKIGSKLKKFCGETRSQRNKEANKSDIKKGKRVRARSKQGKEMD